MRSRYVFITVLVVIASACSSNDATTNRGDADFWALLAFSGSPVEAYSSVAKMAAAADLVVLGTVADVVPGREWGDAREESGRVSSLLLQIQVEDLLSGTLPGALDNGVTVEYSVAGTLEHLSNRLRVDGLVSEATGQTVPYPSGRGLWFLRLRDDAGTELAASPAARYSGGVSYRLVTPQGAVFESAEGAFAPLGNANIEVDDDGRPLRAGGPEGQLAAEIARSSFSELVELARKNG